MKILVFGNPLVKQDSLPLKLLPLLRNRFPEIDFKEYDTVENLEGEGPHILILDTVFGIKNVTLLSNIEEFPLEKRYSMHDLDLSIQLRLLKKLNLIKSVKILAVPPYYPKQKALKELSSLISTLFSRNE